MGKLKYSFIIPVYNCENYLEDCIYSIQNQGLNDSYEIILVDDGSLDGSGAVCDRYAESWDNIYAFHKENGGASSARNYGIEQAKGDYLLFIDGDDTLDEKLGSHLEQLELLDDTMIIYGMSFDYYNGDKIERTDILAYPESGSFSMEQLKENFKVFFQSNSLSSACNKVFSKKLIDDNHIRFDESMNLYEDFEFVLRYLQHVKQLYCIKEGYYHYRLIKQNNHSYSRVKDLNRLMGNLKKVGCSIDSLGMGTETFEELYFQLIYLHLLYSSDLKFSIDLMFKLLDEDEWFKNNQNSIVALGENERKLLEYIKSRQNKELCKWIKGKRFKTGARRKIRSFVKLLQRTIRK